jgi:two-component system, chemotaxis family, protein-glutamate methylesterase/glutaminase
MTLPRRARVLVVDDSAFARKVLREVLGAHPGIEVVGVARDGLEALELVAALEPDVITLDLVMPNLDGIGVLRELASLRTRSRVVVVSISGEDSELVVEALQLGAVGLVRKPSALATDRLYELSGDLIRAVLHAAAAASPLLLGGETVRAPVFSSRTTIVKVLVIGTSTGGPQALTRLLSAMPADFPVPIVAALHIPGDYTEALAKRLDSDCALHVVEASDGLLLCPGLVVLAKGGIHLKLERDGEKLVVRLTPEPASSLYFPSVDLLFASAAAVAGPDVLGVVLTGMGDDGLVGSRAIALAGGRVLTEAESSCVVYGMPRSVKEAGYSSGEAALGRMTEAILRLLSR